MNADRDSEKLKELHKQLSECKIKADEPFEVKMSKIRKALKIDYEIMTLLYGKEIMKLIEKEDRR